MNKLLRSLALLGAVSMLAAACAASPAETPLAGPPDIGPVIDAPVAVARDITLIRSPSCSCCAGHEAHLQRAGYAVSSQLTDAYTTVKDAHGVPAEMRSCHTSLIGRYFVEGHVPVAAIEQLLAERPDIDGIALPGMPEGSPGMGGTATAPLVVYAIVGGEVVGAFGSFAAPFEQ